jgi:hypothetical protein
VLICIISLTLQLPILLNIHNRCQNINLTSPVCFVHGGRWRAAPDFETNVNAVMKNLLGFDSGQDILEGILAYKIQRRHDNYDKSAYDESKDIQFLVAWYVSPTSVTCTYTVSRT